MPVQKKGGTSESTEKKPGTTEEVKREHEIPGKPIVFKKLTQAQEIEYKKVDEVTSTIGKISAVLSEIRKEGTQVTTDLQDLLMKFHFQLGMSREYILENELTSQINVIEKLKKDPKVQEKLTEFKKSLHGQKKGDKTYIDVDTIINSLSLLSKAVTVHLQQEVELESPKRKSTP